MYSILKKLDELGDDRPPIWFWFIMLLVLTFIIYLIY